jgi:hypothetical protein
MRNIADRVSDSHHGIKLLLSVKAASALANCGSKMEAEAVLRTAESKIEVLEERLLPEAMTTFCDALLKGALTIGLRNTARRPNPMEYDTISYL